MAIELITGRAGTQHVDSADFGAFFADVFGSGNYILSGCGCTIVNANTVKVAAGELLCEGRHTRVTGSGENVALDNGVSGYKRNDIIAAHYTKDASGIESVSLVVVKGAAVTGTPSDPAMPSTGKVLNGASDAYWPLYRVPIDGLTPQTPEVIATPNPTTLNAMINALPSGTSTPVDGDFYVSQYAGGGTDNVNYYRRPVSALWSYIKGKADALYALVGHKHGAGDITSGTLAIARGGTGATTASAARTALGLGTAAVTSPGDYIVESGGSAANGFWYKFNNGYALVFASYVRNMSCQIAWGSGYDSGDIQLSWPITFLARPYEFGIITAAGNGSITECSTTGSNSTTQSRVYKQARFTSSNAQDVTLTVFAFGRWK